MKATDKLIEELKTEQTCPSENIEEAIRQLEFYNSELTRLKALMTGEPEVIKAEFSREAGLLVEMEHWAVRLLAQSYLETLKGGRDILDSNYMIMNLTTPGPDPIGLEITVQKQNGKTPGRKLAEARKIFEYILDYYRLSAEDFENKYYMEISPPRLDRKLLIPGYVEKIEQYLRG